MFLFQFVKHIIETVIEIYELLLIWWVDPQYPWSQGIGSPIWGSSMTRVKSLETFSNIKGQDLNQRSGERLLAVSGNALDHTAMRAGPDTTGLKSGISISHGGRPHGRNNLAYSDTTELRARYDTNGIINLFCSIITTNYLPSYYPGNCEISPISQWRLPHYHGNTYVTAPPEAFLSVHLSQVAISDNILLRRIERQVN